jgi:hypothetical protein
MSRRKVESGGAKSKPVYGRCALGKPAPVTCRQGFLPDRLSIDEPIRVDVRPNRTAVWGLFLRVTGEIVAPRKGGFARPGVLGRGILRGKIRPLKKCAEKVLQHVLGNPRSPASSDPGSFRDKRVSTSVDCE